jgi:hypothetical protein
VAGGYDYNGTVLPDDIVVILFSKTYNVLTAVYLETDARPDGYIDLVRIQVDDGLQITQDMLSELYKTVSLPAHRCFSYTESDFLVTGNGFAIRVAQDKSQIPVPSTAVSPQDTVKVALTSLGATGVIMERRLYILDSLGPVVYKGIYSPSVVDQDRDTLETFFSEDIKLPANISPFLFFNIRNPLTFYDMDLQLMSMSYSNTMKFLVISSEKEYPETNDSIWIEKDGGIEDITGILQNRDTRPALLIVKPYPLDFNIVVINPISLSNLPIHFNLINRYQITDNNEGALIIIEITGPVLDPERLSAVLDVFDPVGNIIKTGITSKYTEYLDNTGQRHYALVMVWDVRNRNGRYVGPGEYCGVLVIRYKNENLLNKRILIGVKE